MLGPEPKRGWHWIDVRDFYENLIHEGKLVVPKTTSGESSNCEHCDQWLADDFFAVWYSFCPGCGAKIIQG